MVKIAFNSPFAQKDEPKKEAAEALVADKVRGAGYLRCREEGGRGTAAGRSGAGGGGSRRRRHLLAEAAGRGKAAGSLWSLRRAWRFSPAAPFGAGAAFQRGGGSSAVFAPGWWCEGEVASLRAAAVRGRPPGRAGVRGPERVAAVCGALGTAIFPSRLPLGRPRAVPSCGLA